MTFLPFCGTIKMGFEGIPQNPESADFTGKIVSRFRVDTAHRLRIEQITIKGDGGGEKGRSCRGAIGRLFLPNRQKRAKRRTALRSFYRRHFRNNLHFLVIVRLGKRRLCSEREGGTEKSPSGRSKIPGRSE